MAPAVSREEAERHIRKLQDAYSAEIRRIYDDAERLMLEKVAKRLERGIDTPGWAERKLAEITKLNDEIGNVVTDLRKLDPKIKAAIEAAYDAGTQAAVADLIQANLTDMTVGAFTRGAAVRTLAAANVDALGSTHFQVLRTAKDIYRQAVAEASSQVSTGVLTRRQASQVVLNRFADKGITGFIDSAGRHWDLSSYAEMAVRTTTGQAAIQGHVDKLEANDKDLVIISDSPGECPLCRPWEGKVLSISGRDPEHPSLTSAREAGLFHANCTHRTHLYIEGLTRPYENTENPQGYEERQEQRKNERMIRQWKRREAAAITPEEKRLASSKVNDWKSAQKDFIDRTGRRRDYGRESITKAR